MSKFLEEDQSMREILDKVANKLKDLRSKVLHADEEGHFDIKSFAYLEDIYLYE